MIWLFIVIIIIYVMALYLIALNILHADIDIVFPANANRLFARFSVDWLTSDFWFWEHVRMQNMN